MIEYTTKKLLNLGYRIENAEITSVDLSMADHGCLVLKLVLKSDSWECVYEGYVLGYGYVGAESFKGLADGMEYLMRIMDVIGVTCFNSLNGKYVRIATKGRGDILKIIGNITKDKWFDPQSFFKEKVND